MEYYLYKKLTKSFDNEKSGIIFYQDGHQAKNRKKGG
jgi:hypothetical protein